MGEWADHNSETNVGREGLWTGLEPSDWNDPEELKRISNLFSGNAHRKFYDRNGILILEEDEIILNIELTTFRNIKRLTL